MKLRTAPEGLLVHDGSRWVSLPAAIRVVGVEDTALSVAAGDLLTFLGSDEALRARATELLATVTTEPTVAADPSTGGLPFTPRSMRAFMLSEPHVIGSGRMLVKNFFPSPVWRLVSLYEKTGRVFPRLKPQKGFWDHPTFYMGNHTMVLADGDDMWWPSHTKALDFELELACVLRSPISDATPEQAREAVGGWFVLNDWSARDVQADDVRHNVFGPVVKSKTFANSIGPDVVTADEFGDWKLAKGRVRVDGELWCEGTTANPVHDIGEMLAYASKGERLDAGDVISTGTMPGCCGLELDRWIKPGQTIELEIDRIGTLTNRVNVEAHPTTAVPA